MFTREEFDAALQKLIAEGSIGSWYCRECKDWVFFAKPEATEEVARAQHRVKCLKLR